MKPYIYTIFPLTETTRKKGTIDVVHYLQEYWDSYTTQKFYHTYTIATVVDDALYAIGKAINPDKYKNTNGYRQFKKDLLERLRREEDE